MMGYTRPVLFWQCREENSARQRRKNAFIAATKIIYGYSPEDDIYIIDSQRDMTAAQKLHELLSQLQPDDKPVIIGINSTTTVKTYKAIMDQGLTIHNDIGLCGPEDWNWDNEMNWPTLLKPTITSIYVPTKQMGYKAAELLVKIIEGSSVNPQTIVLTRELHIRESTDLTKEKNLQEQLEKVDSAEADQHKNYLSADSNLKFRESC